MEVRHDSVVQRQRLRTLLRRARDDARRTQRDAAREMHWSLSKVIRIEAGEVSISPNDLNALLKYYEVTDKGVIEHAQHLARTGRGPSAFTDYRDTLEPGLLEYLAYESAASAMTVYQPLVIPGLLQIESYALALAAGLTLAEVDVERAKTLWEVRQRRQELLDRPDASPRMLFLLDEAVIRRRVGGRRVMLEQLQRIRQAAEDHRITIRVISFAGGAYAGMGEPFVLLQLPHADLSTLVHLETSEQVTFLDDAKKTSHYERVAATLEDQALTPDDSVALMDGAIADLRRMLEES